ncbi:unnamed protein product [Heligmosomoides polygyrus]|uniref:Uncharacterized protein n=1 Tax=Heligmosomoides polygyrus TaxID=6339 RepID=A0A183FA42_HELPZ|nr:unnamed protein product [Heligmosomoides polygyrus]
MFRSAAPVASNDEFKPSPREMTPALPYPARMFPSRCLKPANQGCSTIRSTDLCGQVVFSAAFISHTLSAQVWECVRKAVLGDLFKVGEVALAD